MDALAEIARSCGAALPPGDAPDPGAVVRQVAELLQAHAALQVGSRAGPRSRRARCCVPRDETRQGRGEHVHWGCMCARPCGHTHIQREHTHSLTTHTIPLHNHTCSLTKAHNP